MMASPSTPVLWMVEIPQELSAEEAQAIRHELGPEDLSEERLPHSLHPRVHAERLLGRYYLRKLLEQETELQGKGWHFELDAQGKPYVRHPSLETSPYVNLSHTHGALLCGLSFDGELGVDIEDSSREVNLDKLAQRCFTQHERDWLKDATSQRDGFFRAWTLKESYIKAIGTGMRTPLQSIEICPDSDEALAIYQDGRRLGTWHFETRCHQHYHMSLCMHASEGRSSDVRWEFFAFAK